MSYLVCLDIEVEEEAAQERNPSVFSGLAHKYEVVDISVPNRGISRFTGRVNSFFCLFHQLRLTLPLQLQLASPLTPYP